MLALLERLGDAVETHQVVQRVVQRAQVGIDLLRQVAGQEAEPLAGLDRRARQHDALHRAALERVDRTGHGEKGLAGARRADAEADVVAEDAADVAELVRRAPLQVGVARAQRDRRLGRVGRALRNGAGDCTTGPPPPPPRPARAASASAPIGLRARVVQRLQQQQGALRRRLAALDAKRLVAPRDAHVQRLLDGAQVLVEAAAQVREASVVERDEGVAKDHGGAGVCRQRIVAATVPACAGAPRLDFAPIEAQDAIWIAPGQSPRRARRPHCQRRMRDEEYCCPWTVPNRRWTPCALRYGWRARAWRCSACSATCRSRPRSTRWSWRTTPMCCKASAVPPARTRSSPPRPCCARAGIDYECEVASGDAGHRLVEMAERFGCDMVIMSARGTGALRQALVGSVSQSVLHACPVPVLIVKPPPEPEAEADELRRVRASRRRRLTGQPHAGLGVTAMAQPAFELPVFDALRLTAVSLDVQAVQRLAPRASVPARRAGCARWCSAARAAIAAVPRIVAGRAAAIRGATSSSPRCRSSARRS